MLIKLCFKNIKQKVDYRLEGRQLGPEEQPLGRGLVELTLVRPDYVDEFMGSPIDPSRTDRFWSTDLIWITKKTIKEEDVCRGKKLGEKNRF